MRIYANFFHGRELDFQLVISPRSKQRNGYIETTNTQNDERLLYRHVSKIGNQSIIFNPSIGLLISNRNNKDIPSAFVPGQTIYQMTGTLEKVYNDMTDMKWVITDQDTGTKLPSAQEVAKRAKKISLFKTMLRMEPCLIPSSERGQEPGILFVADRTSIGSMLHYEVRALLHSVQHFDIKSYELLVGLVDRVDLMDQKLDFIINSLLKPQPPKKDL